MHVWEQYFSLTRSVSTLPLIALADSPLKSIVWLGAFVVLLSKGAKCSFDPTKEMAFIPLDKELRSNGRFWPMVLWSVLVSLLAEQQFQPDNANWYGSFRFGICFGVITLVLGIWWLYAVLRLGKLYTRQVAAVPL